LAQNPNIVAVNTLVGDAAGRGTLHYVPEYLGGATMTDVGQWGEAKRSVELDVVTIDGFLPGGLEVDLVKIDVEGHEPLVIRGMENTIRRSSNIRIFLEFVEPFLAHTVNADQFAQEIDSLGLRICRLLPGFRLELIERGEIPHGANFCLLTRTPEKDSANVLKLRNRLTARLARDVRWLKAKWDSYRHVLGRM
jgi:hypothetical protein